MQRHKKPLDFTESPYDGRRHNQSPVFAAERPFMASSISAELLSAQWISPQFPDKNDTCSHLAGSRKTRRATCKRAKTQKRSKETVEMKENNIFPALNFPNNTKESPKCQKRDTSLVPLRRSKRKASHLLNEIAVLGHQQKPHVNSNKNNFLFSLGSPKPATLSGEILVPETPENEMFKTNSRLKRTRDYI